MTEWGIKLRIKDPQWGLRCQLCQLQSNLDESGWEADAWADSQCSFCSIVHWAHIGFDSKSVPYHCGACLDLAHCCPSCDSDWFRLDVHSLYHLFSFDRESLYLTAESLHHDSAWTCRSNLLQSQPACRVACHLMPAAPADARAATSVVGWGTGHHPSLSRSFFLSFSLSISLFFSPASLIFLHTLVFFTPLHWYVSQICPLCALLLMHCF